MWVDVDWIVLRSYDESLNFLDWKITQDWYLACFWFEIGSFRKQACELPSVCFRSNNWKTAENLGKIGIWMSLYMFLIWVRYTIIMIMVEENILCCRTELTVLEGEIVVKRMWMGISEISIINKVKSGV